MNRTTNALTAFILVAVTVAGAAFAVPSGLRRTEPIGCAGNSDLVVRGAVLVQGNGEALIKNSWVEGGRAALVAFGNGEIRYLETTLRGATRTGGQGEIMGDDGVLHHGGAPAGGRGEVRIGLPGGIRLQDGDSTISIGAGGIVVDDGSDTVSVRPGPGGLRIETDGAAVILDADVTSGRRGQRSSGSSLTSCASAPSARSGSSGTPTRWAATTII